jgi:uncharacterized protein
MSPDLERLIRLQQLDLAAEARRRTLADLPAALQALDERISTRQQTLDAIKARLAENQATRRALDKDLAVVQGRLTKFKDQLMEVKTNKEYHAMQTEIGTAEELVRRQEDLLLDRMEEAETLAAELKAAEAALKSGQADVTTERRQMDEERTQIEAQLQTTTARRGQLGALVSSAALTLFEHVSKHRKGLAMSEARDGHCTQCHVRLRPQIYNEVRRNETLIQCESCSRILYFIPAAGADAAAPPS